jgi:hypothetical protein
MTDRAARPRRPPAGLGATEHAEKQTNRFALATMTLMAEPDPAADETVARNSAETVAAPNSAAPDAVDLTWSRDDGDDIQSAPEVDRQSWRATWRQAGALLMGGLALAGAIVVAFWVLTPNTKAVQPPTALPTPKEGTTSAPTTPATASAPAGAPSSIASTADQDNKYVQALNDQGISFANPEAAVYNGKLVCDDIRHGMTVPQIVAAFRASNPALGGHADTYVAISVHTYCPQNGNLVSGGS